MNKAQRKVKKKKVREERIKKEKLEKKKVVKEEKKDVGNKFSKSCNFERNFGLLNMKQ